MNIYRIIPKSIRIKLRQFLISRRYDVQLGKKAIAKNTIFEGRNILREEAYISNSKIGLGSYISEYSVLNKVEIGKYTCIGTNVRNNFGRHPSDTFVSIHPAFYSTSGQAGFTFAKEQLFAEHIFSDKNSEFVNKIGNDVWIGSNVLIMEGITIGDGAIIATGAIVTKDVHPYTIVGGIPAKLIRKRFTEEQIEFLLEFKWWEKDFEWVKENVNLFSDINAFLIENK